MGGPGRVNKLMSCAVCNEPAPHACGKCGLASYCSSDHQRVSWPTHKFLCSAAIEIKCLENRGMGVVARQAFAVGDEIFREKPLVSLPTVLATSQEEAEAKAANQITTLIEALPDAARSLVLGLTDVHHAEATPYGIFRTNGIPMSGADGLFAKTCRLNHSCSPNSRYTWRADLKRELVFALRPIAAGEELTVEYKDCNRPCAERRLVLEQMFKFVCACSSCCDSSEESDNRRAMIGGLIERIPAVGYDDQPAALEIAERVLELMAEEDVATATNRMGLYLVASVFVF